MDKKNKRQYCFTFICQQGDIEIQSLLLAASLKRFLRCEHELVAAVPTPAERWGAPDASTLQQLEEMGARIVHITNEIDPNYPIGNKVSCLRIHTEADKQIFMDSDMLCLRKFNDQSRFALPFNAKPADLATFTTDVETWQKVYAAADAVMPRLRMPATVSGDFTPPYFNAGFIAVQSKIGFGDTWLDCCKRIDTDPEISNKRPWLDQIALSAAIQKLGLSYDCLDESYNYPAHLKPLDARRLPCFCHYHFPEVIRREPLLNALIKEIAKQYPAIGQIIASHPKWSTLLENYRGISKPPLWRRLIMPRKAQPSPPPELIITGIPRSGTSYLCNLLHRIENCVVINEPSEIFEPLINQSVPWKIATFYKDIRRDILDGKPIKNKLDKGKVVEDTLIKDKITTYTPRVTIPDFILATKNTLTYLARLDAIQRAMPHARVVACVRNPIDTIASWKTSFPHLKEADINRFPVGHPDDPWLCGRQRKGAAYIAGVEDAAERRSALWRYLAELILAQAKNLILVRYEELVVDPMKVLKEILKGWKGHYRMVETMEPSQPRLKKRAALNEKDVQSIRAICTQSAAELAVRI